MKKFELKLDGNSLTIGKIEEFIESNLKVSLTQQAKKNILKSRNVVNEWIDNNKVIYGVTTGFGEFANVRISKKDLKKLQYNLIVSHSAGVGEYLPAYIVKIMMLLRVNALAKGFSGIRLETLELLISMINNNIIPLIPSQGSVGSSGDLAPLAHLVLTMIGKGKVKIVNNVLDEEEFQRSKGINSKTALRKYKLHPIELEAKEGLALINGTQMMTAFASFICINAKRMLKLADIAGALSNEALRGTDRAYDLRIHQLRPYKGQIDSAKNLNILLKNSEIRKSHLENDPRVQDSYSIRCMPQIHGASRDTVNYVCSIVEIEINSANDNPLIFADTKEHLEGGNFHGQPIALAMDFMAIALSELANVAERRIERMLNGSLSNLPRFLTKHGGLNSGLMIAQYTAASLVSENKVLSHPASVDSIPTSANQEDHNSMGSIASQKCLRILRNVQKVQAIELFTAAQAVDFLKPLKCGQGTEIIYNFLRKYVKTLNSDRVISDNINTIIKFIKNNSLLKTVESKVSLH